MVIFLFRILKIRGLRRRKERWATMGRPSGSDGRTVPHWVPRGVCQRMRTIPVITLRPLTVTDCSPPIALKISRWNWLTVLSLQMACLTRNWLLGKWPSKSQTHQRECLRYSICGECFISKNLYKVTLKTLISKSYLPISITIKHLKQLWFS